jgi:hypothetical protein
VSWLKFRMNSRDGEREQNLTNKSVPPGHYRESGNPVGAGLKPAPTLLDSGSTSLSRGLSGMTTELFNGFRIHHTGKDGTNATV